MILLVIAGWFLVSFVLSLILLRSPEQTRRRQRSRRRFGYRAAPREAAEQRPALAAMTDYDNFSQPTRARVWHQDPGRA